MSTEIRRDENNTPKSMKAARVTQFGKPLEFQDVDVPQPGPGEVLVKVRVCGICHTDLHMRKGDLSNAPELPQTMGHEGVGEVFQTGPGVEKWKVGDRVMCGVVWSSCGHCSACLSGCETGCQQVELSGCTKDGQLSQFFLAKEDFLVKVPGNLRDEEAAPINCAGLTTYKALKLSKLWCGQWLAIVGAAGGLGYYAVQYARAMGLKIIAIDKGQEKIKHLKEFEGEHIHCFDIDEGDVVKKIMDLTDNRGVHCAMILAPSKDVFEQAPKYLRKCGKLLVVGQPPSKDPVEFDMVSLVINCHSVIGSLCGTRCDLMEAVQLLSDGYIKSEVKLRDFSEVNDILDEIEAGQVIGRNVVKIPGGEAEE